MTKQVLMLSSITGYFSKSDFTHSFSNYCMLCGNIWVNLCTVWYNTVFNINDPAMMDILYCNALKIMEQEETADGSDKETK